MKTILFPTDFSINSMHAIRYGLELFKEQNVRYILFNAYVDPSVGASMTYVFEDQMRDISMTMLKKLNEDLKEEYESALDMDLINRYGDLPYSLRPLLEGENVDLVIMGASGANTSIFGSNAFATMRDMSCPVLTVPLQSPIASPKRIGLASYTELIGDETLLEPLHEVARITNAQLTGIHVNTEHKSEDAADEHRGPDALPYINLEQSDAVNGIELAIGEHDLDMLSIIIPKRGMLDKIFHKSVSKQIAKHISIPIITLPE